jgi:hypothetical protein
MGLGLLLLSACGGEPRGKTEPAPGNRAPPLAKASESVAAKPAYEGNFEQATERALVGWAWDPSRPDAPITIDVFDGTNKVASAPADQFRADLRAAEKGNGKHGFLLPFPPQLQDGKEHTLSIRPAGSDAALGPALTVKSPAKK